MNMDFNLFTPTKLLFGRGKLNELGNQKLPGKKALLLISSGKSVKVNGTLDRVTAQLEKAGVAYTICNNIHENPSKEVVMEAAACAKENGCDFILALGGGAVLDSAVAVAAMATNPGDLWDYVYGGTGKAQPLQHPGLPIVTIATTSGTGSEINCWGVISNHETNEKIGFGAPELNPVLAIVDPEDEQENEKYYPVLSQYIVYTKAGQSLSLGDYVTGLQRGSMVYEFDSPDMPEDLAGTEVSITDGTDYNTPGTYTAEFSYTPLEGVTATTKMTVVVEE